MKITGINFVLCLLSLIVCISCNESKQASVQKDIRITHHKISTNERAVNNSITDSTLLAPDFSFPSMDGDTFTLSEHRGKVVVVNLWATWCGPCIREIPDFIALQDEFKDKGVEFVGISLDEKGWKVVRPFVKEHHINYKIVLDRKGSIINKYPLQGLPDTYIINKQGEVAHVIISMTSRELLRPLLTHLSNI